MGRRRNILRQVHTLYLDLQLTPVPRERIHLIGPTLFPRTDDCSRDRFSCIPRQKVGGASHFRRTVSVMQDAVNPPLDLHLLGQSVLVGKVIFLGLHPPHLRVSLQVMGAQCVSEAHLRALDSHAPQGRPGSGTDEGGGESRGASVGGTGL